MPGRKPTWLMICSIATGTLACGNAEDDSSNSGVANEVGGTVSVKGGRSGNSAASQSTSIVGLGGLSAKTSSFGGSAPTLGGSGSGSASSKPNSPTPSPSGGATAAGASAGQGGRSNSNAGRGGSSNGAGASASATAPLPSTAGRASNNTNSAAGGRVGSLGGANATGGVPAAAGGRASADSGGASTIQSRTNATQAGKSGLGGGGSGGFGSRAGAAALGGNSAAGTTGACNPAFADPPTNVSAWINESWNAQLGSNIKSRKAWLLDSIQLGKGQINLCVRWGASTAPTAAVKSGMAAAVEKWFNDWFTQLADYGCFAYGAGNVVAKVTGWAVKPGNTSWVSDLGSEVKIYTETDSEGEPKCSDDCSFFTNWSHSFPKCPGGEAFHHDYWLWLDDKIDGGAAAVGGDWGLRMPVSNFVSSMGKSNLVIEHEMGHGFGFQDYYDWTGSTPNGGSLMIVGSTNSQSPTTADQWLLKRTWKEMKTIRGW